MLTERLIKSGLLGIAVGDALGVPYEFKTREQMKNEPATSMTGFGTYMQEVGTWSDDTAMSLCLAEVLAESSTLDMNTLGQNYVKWYKDGYWTARDETFDIGIATFQAMNKIMEGVHPLEAGGSDEWDNGNGSLMRILPLVFYTWNKDIDERYELCKQVSSITHAHIRSVIACFYYLEFARNIILENNKKDTYQITQKEVNGYLQKINAPEEEIKLFGRLLENNIQTLKEEEIKSSGYVIHTLEASIWCFMNTDYYKDAVLLAVNLGSDTDTTAAVTGGISAMYYGLDSIPAEWLEELARKEKIEELAERVAKQVL